MDNDEKNVRELFAQLMRNPPEDLRQMLAEGEVNVFIIVSGQSGAAYTFDLHGKLLQVFQREDLIAAVFLDMARVLPLGNHIPKNYEDMLRQHGPACACEACVELAISKMEREMP